MSEFLLQLCWIGRFGNRLLSARNRVIDHADRQAALAQPEEAASNAWRLAAVGSRSPEADLVRGRASLAARFETLSAVGT